MIGSQICPNCNMRVLPSESGNCPSCHLSLVSAEKLPPDSDEPRDEPIIGDSSDAHDQQDATHCFGLAAKIGISAGIIGLVAFFLFTNHPLRIIHQVIMVMLGIVSVAGFLSFFVGLLWRILRGGQYVSDREYRIIRNLLFWGLIVCFVSMGLAIVLIPGGLLLPYWAEISTRQATTPACRVHGWCC
jgi:hypothetical protein